MKLKLLLLFCIFLLPMLVCAEDPNLKCSLKLSSECTDIAVIYLQNGTGGWNNAHAGLGTQRPYNWTICCRVDGFSGTLQKTCDDTNGKFLRLSNATNAHAQNYSIGTYSSEACMSLGSDSEIKCNFKNSTCLSSETGILSLNKTTNSHVSAYGNYSNNVCCTSIISGSDSSGTGGSSGSGGSQITWINITADKIWRTNSINKVKIDLYTSVNTKISPLQAPLLNISPSNNIYLKNLSEVSLGTYEAWYVTLSDTKQQNYNLNVKLGYLNLESNKAFIVSDVITTTTVIKNETTIEKITGFLVKKDENTFLKKYWVLILICLLIVLIPLIIIIIYGERIWRKIKKNSQKPDLF
jgi:hypothetical protein